MMKKVICIFLLTITIPRVYGAEITVSAASSLIDAFTEIARCYEQRYPTDKIRLNFASSGSLLQQIINGAPVDVFASADQLRMNEVEKAGLVMKDSRRNFTSNALVAIVPSSDKQNYPDLSTFIHASSIVRLAVANPEHVPAGRYSKNALVKKGLWEVVAAKAVVAQNVRQALEYVARGEVDGGFVYQTDAKIMQNHVRVALKVPLDEPLTYPIAVLKNTQEAATALNFVDFVNSQTGKKILQHYGFLDFENSP